MQLTVKTSVDAPIARVWRTYTDPSEIVQWNAASDDWHTTHARVDLRAGGSFSSRMEARDGSFGFDFEGTYTRITENSLIEYVFGERRARVEFIEDCGKTSVTVSFDSEESHSIEQQQQGWQAILDSFKRHVESAATEKP